MPDRTANPVIVRLQERIAHLEGVVGRAREVLPFGLAELDRRLPGGGLALGALHEVAGGGNGAVDGAAAARTRPHATGLMPAVARAAVPSSPRTAARRKARGGRVL